MDKNEIKQIMDEVVDAIADAGYNPLEQLQGYVMLGNINYITRHNNAREKIKQLSIADVIEYISR